MIDLNSRDSYDRLKVCILYPHNASSEEKKTIRKNNDLFEKNLFPRDVTTSGEFLT